MSCPGEKLGIHRIFDQEENEMETIEIKLPDYLAKKLLQEESSIQNFPFESNKGDFFKSDLRTTSG